METFIQKAQQFLVWGTFAFSHLPFFAHDKDNKQNLDLQESLKCDRIQEKCTL